MSGFNHQRCGIVADISKVLFIVQAGDFAVTTVTIESYTFSPSPRLFLCACVPNFSGADIISKCINGMNLSLCLWNISKFKEAFSQTVQEEGMRVLTDLQFG